MGIQRYIWVTFLLGSFCFSELTDFDNITASKTKVQSFSELVPDAFLDSIVNKNMNTQKERNQDAPLWSEDRQVGHKRELRKTFFNIFSQAVYQKYQDLLFHQWNSHLAPHEKGRLLGAIITEALSFGVNTVLKAKDFATEKKAIYPMTLMMKFGSFGSHEDATVKWYERNSFVTESLTLNLKNMNFAGNALPEEERKKGDPIAIADRSYPEVPEARLERRSAEIARAKAISDELEKKRQQEDAAKKWLKDVGLGHRWGGCKDNGALRPESNGRQ